MNINFDLERLVQNPEEIGNNIYGPIIQNFPPGSDRLCGLNPEWGKASQYPYVGAASRWIAKLNNGEKAVPHLVEIDGTRMIVKAIETGASRWSRYYSTDIFQIKKLRETIRSKPELAQACLGVDTIDYKYIGLDDFACELLNTFIASSVLRYLRMPDLINRVRTYALCGRFGLMLTDQASEGDLYSVALGKSENLYKACRVPQPAGGYQSFVCIDHNIAESIILQVLTLIDALKNTSDFVHGDLRLSSVLLNKEPVNYTYRNISVFGDYMIKLKNFVNSSILVFPKADEKRKVRLFNEIRATRYLPAITSATDFKLDPKAAVNCVNVEVGSTKINTTLSSSYGKCYNQYWWKIGKTFNSTVNLILCHSGLPYYKSIDFYMFMTSLMMVPMWYNAILSSPKLNTLWSAMWMSDEVRNVTFDTLSSHTKGKPQWDDVIDILRKYHMSCSALEVALTIFAV